MLYLPGEEDHGSIQQLLWQRQRDKGEMGKQQRGQREDAAPQICSGDFVLAFLYLCVELWGFFTSCFYSCFR